jgi:acyl-CoA thioesterase-1
MTRVSTFVTKLGMVKIFLFLSWTLVWGTAYGGTTRIVMLGDSLTEGYGVSKSSAYPALVEQALKAKGKNVEIINAGVSGSTTASGLSRLKWQLKGNPQIVVIALGANDVLRGIDLGQSEKNLAATIILAKKQNLKVLLVGMRAPPNYGRAYDGQLAGMFRRLSEKHSVPLLPFLLEGVGGRPELNQADRIHPNEKGHKILAETVLKSLLPLL